MDPYWGARPVPPDAKKYEHLENVCFLPTRTTGNIKNSVPYVRKPNKHFVEFQQYEPIAAKYILDRASYAEVKKTKANLWRSVDKCDAPGKHPEDKLQDEVDKIVKIMLAPILTQTTVLPGQTMEVVSGSSPGKYWKERGCATKGEAIQHPQFMDHVHSIDHAVVQDYNTKQEFLDYEDIVTRNKIRGTFNPPADFVIKEKFLYDNQNKAFIENHDKCWIKYGFVKQFGGFDRLGKEFEEFEVLGESDVTGYDRLIQLLKTMKIRNGFLILGSVKLSLVYFVLFNTVYSIFVGPDGVVRIRKTGNSSGSSNTTTNNSIAHLIIIIRFICNLWLASKYKRLPTPAEILKHHKYAIYSDDALGGHNISHLGLSIDDFRRIMKETYLEFGLELKESQTHITVRVPGSRIDRNHSFLGSNFHYDEKLNMYVPYPRIGKICTSLAFDLETLSDEVHLVKICALASLASVEPELSRHVLSFLRFFLERNNSLLQQYQGPELDLLMNNMYDSRDWLLRSLGKYEGGRTVLKDLGCDATSENAEKQTSKCSQQYKQQAESSCCTWK